MTVAPVAVDAPRVSPALGGLLPVADIVDVSDPHVAFGIEYQSFLCDDGGFTAGCVDAPDGVPVDAVKEFTGSHIVPGVPVVLYAGVECDLFGSPYTQQAQDRLAGSEDRLVAEAFYRHAAWGAWSDGEAPVYIREEITADNIVDAVGHLEQYAAEHYAGQPVLHMNRYTATLAIAADVVAGSLDGTLMTVQGTPVANSAGYPDGVIFITGAVHLWRTSVDTYAAPNLGENTDLALAERTYVLSTDCLLAIAGDVTPPTELAITSIDPDEVVPGETVSVTVTGTGFTPETVVSVGGETVTLDPSSTETELVFSWTAPTTGGDVDVVVTDGSDTATGTITVLTPPTITAVDPTTGPVAGGTTITVTGTGFEE